MRAITANGEIDALVPDRVWKETELALAGAERLIVEFFRAKDDRFFGILTLAQLISIGLIVFGAWLFVRLGPAESGDSPSRA